jgi:hypothetical protein
MIDKKEKQIKIPLTVKNANPLVVNRLLELGILFKDETGIHVSCKKEV